MTRLEATGCVLLFTAIVLMLNLAARSSGREPPGAHTSDGWPLNFAIVAFVLSAVLFVYAAVTGYGRAEKPQVQQMIRSLLKLESLPKQYDASDALAIALCHARRAAQLRRSA